MSFPTVCVAIPVKNGRDYLAEAIESVLAQEGVELSVCVLDNRSDDDSLEVARRYTSDARVTAELNPVDVFYYGSLNRILAGTQAEYFVPFAADDVMYSDNLARKVQALRDTGAGFVSSSSDLIDESGAKVGMQPDHAATPALVAAPEFFARIAPRNAVSCQSVLARVDALRAIGGFDGRSFYAGDWLDMDAPGAALAGGDDRRAADRQPGARPGRHPGVQRLGGLQRARHPHHAGPCLPRRGDARALAGMARPDGGRGPRRRRRGP